MKRRALLLTFSLAAGVALAIAVVALANNEDPSETGIVPSAQALAAPPLNEALAVFSNPRSAADDLPGSLTDVAAGLSRDVGPRVQEELRPGEPRIDESRLLLSNLGSLKMSFFAFPSSTGKVCYVISSGPAGCEDSGVFAASPVTVGLFDPDRLGSGVPISVYGLVRNDVAYVEVVDTNGSRRTAEVANNAFFLELNDNGSWPESVIVGYRDRTETTTVMIAGGPPPS